MSYKVIIDSCGELTEEMKASGNFQTAPLTLDVAGYHIIDDETFDQADFLRRVREAENVPKSACPSPEYYKEAFRCEADHVYAVTLSSQLSGSYNSAVLGQNLYHEEYGEKQIHVFDSKSASIGQTLLGLKIAECEEQGMSFEEVIRTVDAYREEQHTYFVLETLDALRKNGRLTGLKAIIATTLNIKPIMGSTPIGSIQQLGQTRGMNKAMKKMGDFALSDAVSTKDRILAISHCNNIKCAEDLKNYILSKAEFKDVILIDTAGVSSLYASDGGIIMVI